jgi:hypothetical protein
LLKYNEKPRFIIIDLLFNYLLILVQGGAVKKFGVGVVNHVFEKSKPEAVDM